MMTSGEDSSSSGRLRPRKLSVGVAQRVTRLTDSKAADGKQSKVDFPSTSSDKPSENKLLCPYCEKCFTIKTSLSKHVTRVHSATPSIKCQFCEHRESNVVAAIRHMTEKHSNEYFFCFDCRTRFLTAHDLLGHRIICDKQKSLLKPYRNKLRTNTKTVQNKHLGTNKRNDFVTPRVKVEKPVFNGVVISCELKPPLQQETADIEDNITTNLILPPNKNLAGAGLEKNAVIVLDDIQWNKRIPSNFCFHNSDADQILSRLGVVHRSPRVNDTNKRDWYKQIEDSTKFEKCFDTSFYTKVASNVHENLSKYLDGSFNRFNTDPDNIIKTRKSKNSVAINTVEGFPTLLACNQYSRSVFDSYLPRSIAPRQKWKWEHLDLERDPMNPDQIKRFSHVTNCIITLVSSLDIWTQLCMRDKYEAKFNNSSFKEKTLAKQNIICNELKEILESREIPKPQSAIVKRTQQPVAKDDNLDFARSLGLIPSAPAVETTPAKLSGECVRPRCFICCACGDRVSDYKTLRLHKSTQHANAQVAHYEIVGEVLLDNDIMKHLYVPPPQQMTARSRPPRGIKECTKCNKPISLEDLHQHILDCAGDTPVVKRKCRPKTFGARRRRPRMPDYTIRKQMRKGIRHSRNSQKNILRGRPKPRTEVGDAETIRKMLADLPPKRHRVTITLTNSAGGISRRDNERAKMVIRKRANEERHHAKTTRLRNQNNAHSPRPSRTVTTKETNTYTTNKEMKTKMQRTLIRKAKNQQANAKRNMPNLRSAVRKLRSAASSSAASSSASSSSATSSSAASSSAPSPSAASLSAASSSAASSSAASSSAPTSNAASSGASSSNAASAGASSSSATFRSRNEPMESDNRKTDVTSSQSNPRKHSGRDNSNARYQRIPDANQQSRERQNPPPQNVPLKHSIARLTAKTETHDKSFQFQPTFLVQQECYKTIERSYMPVGQPVYFENDTVECRPDKPPLEHYHPDYPNDSMLYQRNKNNKPRKGLNDCIAMLKNKVQKVPGPKIPDVVSVTNNRRSVQCDTADMPQNLQQEIIPSTSKEPDLIVRKQYNQPGSTPRAIPPAHATNVISVMTAPLDLSGKPPISLPAKNEGCYDTLDLSYKHASDAIYQNVDVVVDLRVKTASEPLITQDLSKKTEVTDKPSNIDTGKVRYQPQEHIETKPPSVTETYIPRQSLSFKNETFVPRDTRDAPPLKIVTTLGGLPQVTTTSNSSSLITTFTSVSMYTSPTCKLVSSSTTHDIKRLTEALLNHDGNICKNTNKITSYEPSVLNIAKPEIPVANNIESPKTNDTDTAKKIALLPKEIVEILGTMPVDSRNQLLDVLPQYMAHPKPDIDTAKEPGSIISTEGSAKTEIATQTAAPQNDLNEKPFTETSQTTRYSTIIHNAGPVPRNFETKIETTMYNNGSSLSNSNMAPAPARDILSLPFKSTPHKTVNEKTASLRAVRIKTADRLKSSHLLPPLNNTPDNHPLHDVSSPVERNSDNVTTAIHQADVSSSRINKIQMNVEHVSEIESAPIILNDNDISAKDSLTESSKTAQCHKNEELVAKTIESIKADQTLVHIKYTNAPVTPPSDSNHSKENDKSDTFETNSNSNIQLTKTGDTNDKTTVEDDSEDDISLALIIKQKNQNEIATKSKLKKPKQKPKIKNLKRKEPLTKKKQKQTIKNIEQAPLSENESNINNATTKSGNATQTLKPKRNRKCRSDYKIPIESDENSTNNLVTRNDNEQTMDSRDLGKIVKEDKKTKHEVVEKIVHTSDTNHANNKTKYPNQNHSKINIPCDIQMQNKSISENQTELQIQKLKRKQQLKEVNQNSQNNLAVQINNDINIKNYPVQCPVLHDTESGSLNSNLSKITTPPAIEITSTNNDEKKYKKVVSVNEDSVKNPVVEFKSNIQTKDDMALIQADDHTTSKSLRRSRRGKSLYTEVLSATDTIADIPPKGLLPLTKKQLIFKKMLQDEENHNKLDGTKETSTTLKPLQEDKPESTIDETTKSSKRKTAAEEPKIVSGKKKKLVKIPEREPLDSTNSNVDYLTTETNSKEEKTKAGGSQCIATAQILLLDTSQTSDVFIPTIVSDHLHQALEANVHKKSDIMGHGEDSVTLIEKKSNQSEANKLKKSNSTTASALFKGDTNNVIKCSDLTPSTNKQEVTKTTCYSNLNTTNRTRSKLPHTSNEDYDPYNIDLEEKSQESSNSKVANWLNRHYSENKTVAKKPKSMNKYRMHAKNYTETTVNRTSKTNNKTEIYNSDSSSVDVPLKNYVSSSNKNTNTTSLGCLENNVKLSKDQRNNHDIDIQGASTSTMHANENAKLNHSSGSNNQQQQVNKDSPKRTRGKKSKSYEEDNVNGTNSIEDTEKRKSEQFLMNYGFLSERQPRQSNLLATKKISETFHNVYDSDDGSFGTKERTPKRCRRKSTLRDDNKDTAANRSASETLEKSDNLKDCDSLNKPEIPSQQTSENQPIITAAPEACQSCVTTNDGDVDPIITKTILESEDARKLETEEGIIRESGLEQQRNSPPPPSNNDAVIETLGSHHYHNSPPDENEDVIYESSCQIQIDSNYNTSDAAYKSCKSNSLQGSNTNKERRTHIQCFEHTTCVELETNSKEETQNDTRSYQTDIIERNITPKKDPEDLKVIRKTETKLTNKETQTQSIEDTNSDSYSGTQNRKLKKIAVGKSNKKDKKPQRKQKKRRKQIFKSRRDAIPDKPSKEVNTFKDQASDMYEDKFDKIKRKRVYSETANKAFEPDVSKNKNKTNKAKNLKTKRSRSKTTSSEHDDSDSESEEKPRQKVNIFQDELVDMMEDKFDKIKRKCRSQVAAVKTTTTVAEISKPRYKGKGKGKKTKMSDSQSNQNTIMDSQCNQNTVMDSRSNQNTAMDSQSNQNTIMTKAALKGYESIKVSIPTTDINMSAITPAKPERIRRKRKRHVKKRRGKKKENQKRDRSVSDSQKNEDDDVYEFKDDDADMFEFRPSTIKERFKSTFKDGPSTSKAKSTFKDGPSTSKAYYIAKHEETTSSGSDGDDFVYDDYVNSGEDTENSENSNGAKYSSDPKKAKRKETIEKNAVMGRIFKNAVKTDKKASGKTNEKQNKNLDQLFDSLLEDEPNYSSATKPEKTENKLSPVELTYDGDSMMSSKDINYIIETSSQSPHQLDSLPSPRRTRYFTDSIEEIKNTINILDDIVCHGLEFSSDNSAGVARHRTRRKCAVGKQNVLAETWSSESEVDMGYSNSGDSAVGPGKRRRSKRGPSLYAGGKRGRFAAVKKVERIPRSSPQPSTSAATMLNESGIGEELPIDEYAWSSSNELNEPGHRHAPQHGWIVGNNHKKLVTMLAHAKGRKWDEEDNQEND